MNTPKNNQRVNSIAHFLAAVWVLSCVSTTQAQALEILSDRQKQAYSEACLTRKIQWKSDCNNFDVAKTVVEDVQRRYPRTAQNLTQGYTTKLPGE